MTPDKKPAAATLGAAPTVTGPLATDAVRVMVVDDSVVIRGTIGRWIDEFPDITVVASHRNGRLAADDVLKSRPDVVILDIEMPEMDGLTALPLILERKPDTMVLVASALSQRGAEITLKALTLGAADYVPKPDGRLVASHEFRHDLIDKIRQLGLRARERSGRPPPPPLGAPVPVQPRRVERSRPKPAPALRPYSVVPPRVVLIGSSTGGPQALTRLFTDVGTAIGSVPVLVVQHMPPTFTAILAGHMARVAGRHAAEACDGEPLLPGRIYFAPGGRHMLVANAGGEPVIQLSDAPPVNFCRPAVDPLFQSAAEVFGPATLGIVLTGMGSDGAAGAVALARAGGTVIAQDEPTSVVWGMPGATVAAGACSDILPIEEIGRKIASVVLGAHL